jgi:hypothetical protein
MSLFYEGPALVPNAHSAAFAEPEVDLDHPSVARVYDYLLGGSGHWAIDRSFACRILRLFPEFHDIARANRMFVNRVVRHLVGRGVRQFIDIGSGILSEGNTHQIADAIKPCRVVYVDNEPIAVAHAELLLDDEGDPGRHAIVLGDLRQPKDVWEQIQDTEVVDLDEPVAMLMFSVLHGIRPEPDGEDEAAQALAYYRELIAPGSYLGISHVTHEGISDYYAAKLAILKEICLEWCGNDVYCRSRESIRALLGDFTLIEPNMVWIPQWHPEDAGATGQDIAFTDPSHAVVWAGVGQKN